MKLYYRYAGIGDALFVNTFAYLKGEETGEKILIGTNHPSIFLHNPHVKILPFKSRKWIERYIRIFSFFGKIFASKAFYQTNLVSKCWIFS